jgi:membrane protein YqaA with SNARE-associated domain
MFWGIIAATVGVILLGLVGWWLVRMIGDRQADRDHHAEGEQGSYDSTA